MSSSPEQISRVLLIAGSEKDLALVQPMLADFSDVTSVTSEKDFIAALENEGGSEHGFDLILSQHQPPAIDGMSSFRIARRIASDVPFFVLSSVPGEEAALEFLDGGVTEYISIDEMDTLPSVMERVLRAKDKNQKRDSAAATYSTIATDALQFLATASELLASSLDYEKTLARVAQLAVPRIADWCAVDVVNDEGQIQRLAVAHIDPKKIQLTHEIEAKYPSDPNAMSGLPQVLRTGRSEFYSEIPEEMLHAAAVNEEHWELIQELGLVSAMVVPLVARKIVFGAITLVSAESKRHFTEIDLQFAEDLGRRAAIAVDNAWLYRKAQEEIEERKEAENALRESEQRYRIVAETASSAILTIDASSTIRFANPATKKIFGYEPEELLGRQITMLMPESYPERHKYAIGRYVETGKRHINWEGVELPGKHKDGHEIALEVSIGEYVNNGEHSFTGFIRDITDKKRIEEALQTSETRFRTMIEQSPLGIQIFDLEGNCVEANRAWEELWSANREELRGYNIHKDPQLEGRNLKEYVERAYRGEAVATPPIFYDPAEMGRPGHPRWIRTFMYPVKQGDQQVKEIAIILEDVTERRKTIEELQQAKERAEANERELAVANQSKDRFLTILSHELRAPLTPIVAMVEALQIEDIPENLRSGLDIIRRNIALEARLIDDLLDLSRISKGKLQLIHDTVDLHALLLETIEIYRSDINAKNIRTELKFDAEEHYVNGDPARIQQIFWNLIKNAEKFTPQGGRISIHTSNISEGDSGKQEKTKRRKIRTEIIDTGIGIDSDIIPRIFDAFEQGEQGRAFGGMGLGLSISKNLVEAQGGTISASSAGRNKGSAFTVEFMTVEAAPTAPSHSGTKNVQRSGRKPVILLVDDHADTSSAVRMLLERQGFDVHVAASSAEAIQIAKEEPIDLIVSDIGLPDESGLMMLPKLRAYSKAPAIALSGFGTDYDAQRSRDAGFQEHLAKPFNVRELREAITKLLDVK